MLHGALRDGRRRAAHAPSTKFSFLCSRPTAWHKRSFAAVAAAAAQGATAASSNKTNAHDLQNATQPKRRARNRLPASHKSKTQACLKRLEACLPPHLRSDVDPSASAADTDFTPNALELAKFLLDTDGEVHRQSLVTWLAIHQGRWTAAVWIVKLLLEHFHAASPRSKRLSNVIQDWNRTGTLDDLTLNPLYMKPQSDGPLSPHIKSSAAASLHDLTDDKPENLSSAEILRHNILGLVWRDIGRMIIACANNSDIAGGEVKPDVLEMIALLHHYELMPKSIYAYVPAESEDAIQQPPTLHLLSSRIFTALSDATWRAREMSAVEDAKRQGGGLRGLMGLEAKGSSYRVRVSGIKPEIWLELILWSCLHGGWILSGVSLLRSLFRYESSEHEQWKPISWRDSLSAIMPFGEKNLLDWDSIKYMFDNRSNATMDDVDITGLRVEKTVSSEVVNAYVDALLSNVNVGVGDRGVSVDFIIRSIRTLRNFLWRADLNLGGGSWDAMMLRLVQSGGVDVERKPDTARLLLAITPKIGEELRSRRSQTIPSYVLDGSAAILGLLHRALYAEIRNGNLDGALRVFQKLQERVDADRHQSLGDFFSHKHLSSTVPAASNGMFTSNFSGIDYPSFSTQIPPRILAAFLDLVVENKAFDFGNWMVGIDNVDIDGPLIPPSLYSDPHVSAALVHFATATKNVELLSKISQLGDAQGEGSNAPKIPSERLQAFFNAQVEMRRWDAAEGILDYMHETEGFNWSVLNAAFVAKAAILESETAVASSPRKTPTRAQAMLISMQRGKYSVSRFKVGNKLNLRNNAEFNTLRVVLASVSPVLAAVVKPLPKFFNFTLGNAHFNQILEAVVASQGSEAGRELVDRFLIADKLEHTEQVESSRKANAQTDGTSGKLDTLPTSMPRFLRDAMANDTLPRAMLDITVGSGKEGNTVRSVAMYGRLHLSLSTAGIIIRQALQEHDQGRNTADAGAEQRTNSSQSPSLDIFVWALHALRRGRIDNSSIWTDLEASLSGSELQTIKEETAEMWKNYSRRRGWKQRSNAVYRDEHDEEDVEEDEEDEEEDRELDAFDRQAQMEIKS